MLSTSAFVNSDGTFADIYYPSQLAMDNKGTNFDDTHSDMTERMLRACQEHGIKVYISPAYSMMVGRNTVSATLIGMSLCAN